MLHHKLCLNVNLVSIKSNSKDDKTEEQSSVKQITSMHYAQKLGNLYILSTGRK